MNIVLAVLLLLSTCEWCGASEAPKNISSVARVAGPEEPGERMVISGRLLRADARTPAPGVVVYLYHTNAKGIYPTRGNETGNARQHGYLRGWLKTDAQGRYRIESIRPGGYPGRRDPAHIHLVVQEPGKPETWIDEIVFADDPRTAAVQGRPGFTVVNLAKRNGTWTGTKDLRLK